MANNMKLVKSEQDNGQAAIERVPPLESAGVVRSFAGLRSMTPDELPVLCECPDVRGYYLACGFSGHGFMHAPAAGMVIADLVTSGKTDVMDIAPFSLERFGGAESSVEGYVF